MEDTPFRICQDLPRPLDDGQVDHLAVEGDRAAPLSDAALVRLDDAAGSLELLRARGEDGVCDLHLGRMDARLAPEAERAREPALGLEAFGVADVDVDEIEGSADPGCRRVEDELRAREQHLLPVGAGLETELEAEIDGAEDERGHTRARSRLVGEAEALRRLDDGDQRRPRRAERL